MPRGQRAEVGAARVNANGYEYVKTDDRGWLARHQLVMEEHLGRQLRPGEYIVFKTAKKHPVTLDMLELRRRGDHRSSPQGRLAQIDARIEELQAEREHLLREMESGP